jgi:hypothetical protein
MSLGSFFKSAAKKFGTGCKYVAKKAWEGTKVVGRGLKWFGSKLWAFLSNKWVALILGILGVIALGVITFLLIQYILSTIAVAVLVYVAAKTAAVLAGMIVPAMTTALYGLLQFIWQIARNPNNQPLDENEVEEVAQQVAEAVQNPAVENNAVIAAQMEAQGLEIENLRALLADRDRQLAQTPRVEALVEQLANTTAPSTSISTQVDPQALIDEFKELTKGKAGAAEQSIFTPEMETFFNSTISANVSSEAGPSAGPSIN